MIFFKTKFFRVPKGLDPLSIMIHILSVLTWVQTVWKLYQPKFCLYFVCAIAAPCMIVRAFSVFICDEYQNPIIWPTDFYPSETEPFSNGTADVILALLKNVSGHLK